MTDYTNESPRTKIIDMIFLALDQAHEQGAKGLLADYMTDASTLLETIESRVTGLAPEGYLLFDDDEADFLEDGAAASDDEPEFTEMTPTDEADIRGARQ